MEIFVLVRDKRKYRIKVLPSTTVLEVKKEMEERSCIPVAWQILWLNGLELRDDYDMEFYEIVDRMIIPLAVMVVTKQSPGILRKPPIWVNLPMWDVDLKMEEESMKVADIKEKISAVARIPVPRIRLFLLNPEEKELKNDEVLSTSCLPKKINVKVEVIPC